MGQTELLSYVLNVKQRVQVNSSLFSYSTPGRNAMSASVNPEQMFFSNTGIPSEGKYCQKGKDEWVAEVQIRCTPLMPREKQINVLI